MLHFLVSALSVTSFSKEAIKVAYQSAGCCPLLPNHTPCSIVHVPGYTASGFTCEQAKELHCSASGDTVSPSCGELCYGVHGSGTCSVSASSSPPPAAASSPPPASAPPQSCLDSDKRDPAFFFTGSAIDQYYPAKTCASMKAADTTGAYASFGWGDPCLKSVAKVAQDKTVGGTAVAPAGFEGKQFSEMCPETCSVTCADGGRRLQERDAKGGRPWPKPSGLMKHRRLDM